jgi:hypothetical protein
VRHGHLPGVKFIDGVEAVRQDHQAAA